MNPKSLALDLKAIPRRPGVYLFFNLSGQVIYVGQSKNLFRRLSQYKNAKRIRAHFKMRSILKNAARVEWSECESPLAALLLENEWIQKFSPEWNEANKFSKYYPYIAIAREGLITRFFVTHQRTAVSNVEYFGVFRSRQHAVECVDALQALLTFVAVRKKANSTLLRALRPRTHFSVEGIDSSWLDKLKIWLKSGDRTGLVDLVLQLTQTPQALSRSTQIDDQLKVIRHFERHEILPLKRAIQKTGIKTYPILQEARDSLFIQARFKKQKRPDPMLTKSHYLTK